LIDLNTVSSSDSESENIDPKATPDRFKVQRAAVIPVKPKPKNPNEKIDKMVVQTTTDEDKLNFITNRIKTRPLDVSRTQPLQRRTHELKAARNMATSSSDDVNSVFNQSPNHKGPPPKKRSPSIPKNTETSKPIQNETQTKDVENNNLKPREFDMESVTSTNGNENKSEKNKLKVERRPRSTSRKYRKYLAYVQSELFWILPR
jgi:hypothetical protein